MIAGPSHRIGMPDPSSRHAGGAFRRRERNQALQQTGVATSLPVLSTRAHMAGRFAGRATCVPSAANRMTAEV